MATAIIELNLPARSSTLPISDLIKQGMQLVAYERIDFNVKVGRADPTNP
jgi:hypothetical protein